MKEEVRIMTTNKTMKDMASIIKEIKEFEDMKKALTKEVDKLKAECIEFMEAESIDEIVTDEGKVTYREVVSKRFDSTSFKKEYLKLYEEYLKLTTNMRFTCN